MFLFFLCFCSTNIVNFCNTMQVFVKSLKINLFYIIVKVFYYICEPINKNEKLKRYGKQQFKQW